MTPGNQLPSPTRHAREPGETGAPLPTASSPADLRIGTARAVAESMTTTWKWQHETAETLHTSAPTDARGLRLRAQCGYTHVHMGTVDGWLQIAVAIRKVALAEQLAKIVGGAS